MQLTELTLERYGAFAGFIGAVNNCETRIGWNWEDAFGKSPVTLKRQFS